VGLGSKRTRFDKDVVEKAYAGWATDLLTSCSAPYSRRAGLPPWRAAERIGGRVLDVGVGTGISLSQYSSPHRIVASTSRSRCCAAPKARMQRHPLANVEMLSQ